MDDQQQTSQAMPRQAAMDVGKMWWLWLVIGIAWLIFGFVILQFDTQSITVVGIIIGVMFLVAGLQYVVIGTQVEGWNWLWYIFGAILIIGGLVAMFNPQRTFLAIANILGFIFLLVGIIWIMEAFMSRGYAELWGLTLLSGVLMVALAFWLGTNSSSPRPRPCWSSPGCGPCYAGSWSSLLPSRSRRWERSSPRPRARPEADSYHAVA